MARGAAITVENNFSQGIITEYSALNFPENAVTEADNVVFNELGRVTRRLGIDYEPEYGLNDVSADYIPETDAVTEYKWTSTSEDGSIKFAIQQIGLLIHIFRGGDSLSANKMAQTIDLTPFIVSPATPAIVRTRPCQFTSGKGYLFVAHQNCESFYVQYDFNTDDFTSTVIDVRIRDLAGVDDGLEIDQRPNTLSNLHKYNLYNQGWDTFTDTSGAAMQALQYWDNQRSDFPSNSDIFWVYRNANNSLDSANINKKYLGNTPAPKGHYIYTAWNVDRTARTGIAGLPTDSSGSSRPSSIIWYAGRVWYAGVADPKYSVRLYFSQIIDGDDKIGLCYQQNDPTSENLFDLLDTDGGTVDLPFIGKVITMKVIDDALIIVGTDGIYTVSGGTDNGPFKATDYSVRYISTIGGAFHPSVINVDGGLMWINFDAMYAIGRDQVGISFNVQNISKNTIQSIVDEIPASNKEFIKAVYNKKDQLVQWLYSDDPDYSGYRYNRILEFNLVSKAFYTYSIDHLLGPTVIGALTIEGQKAVTSLVNVTDNSLVVVTDNLTNNVQVEVTSFSPNLEVFKYTTYSGGDLTYSEFWNSDYRDWVEFDDDGVSYDSYFISGYRIRGDVLRSFQSSPIAIVLDNLTEGEVIFKGIYDYGSRESMPQWLYSQVRNIDAVRNYNRGSYLIRRIKPRGKGKSFQLSFQSDGDKPFSIVGWSTFDTGGQTP